MMYTVYVVTHTYAYWDWQRIHVAAECNLGVVNFPDCCNNAMLGNRMSVGDAKLIQAGPVSIQHGLLDDRGVSTVFTRVHVFHQRLCTGVMATNKDKVYTCRM